MIVMVTLSPALALAMSLVAPEVATEVMAGRHPVVRGALAGDHALVFGQIDQAGPLPGGGSGRPERTRLELSRSWPWGGCDAVLRAALSGDQPELIDLSGDSGGGQWWPTRPGPVPLRWHLSPGVLYYASCHADEHTASRVDPQKGRLQGPNGSICRVPLTAPVLAAGRVDPMGEGRDRIAARTAALREAWDGGAPVPLDPVEERFGSVFSPHRSPRRPEPELWRTHYDFHPVGPPGRFELYVSDPRGLVRHHSERRQEFGQDVRSWDEFSAHPPAWVGPFYLVAAGADRHFVVPGGRVYTLPAGARPGSALVKTWDNDPVLALVHDADAGKSYTFTRTVYFPLAAKPQPKPHDIRDFAGATSEQALETVAQCGRVIRSAAK